MVRMVMPKMYTFDEFLEKHPDFPNRGVVALFPTLFEHDREDKRQWLESQLVEGTNGSTRRIAEYITFCNSGDALILMTSAEVAKKFASRSPLYKIGTEVILEPWSTNLKVRLQYRGAFNRVVELVEEEW